MTITAHVAADSLGFPWTPRLATLQLRYPRFIHAEVMTHRVFSRNASSSRAIPIERMIADIMRDTAEPLHWGKNQKGMQAREELNREAREACRMAWYDARNEVITRVRRQIAYGLHKQIANRMLEPWSHINVVVTSTSWANFLALRDHEDAQPEVQALAIAIQEALDSSTPKRLKEGEWHLPFIREQDRSELTGKSPEKALRTLQMVSVARCARTSFLTHDGRVSTIEEDVDLYGRLVVSKPLHASPAEHQATPDVLSGANKWFNPHLHGNLEGWIQLRKLLPGEYVADKPYQTGVPQTLVA